MRIGEYLSKASFSGTILIAGNLDTGSPVMMYAMTGKCDECRNRALVSAGSVLSVNSLDKSRLYDVSYKSGAWKVYANGEHGGVILKGLDSGLSLLETLDQLELSESERNAKLALVTKEDGSYSIAVMRNDSGKTDRVVYHYKPHPGFGHVIASFDEGKVQDPVLVRFKGRLSALCTEVWDSLDSEDKVSLYVGYGDAEKVINKRIH